MRRDIKVRGASFSGTSDLTIVAPIRKGFVPALDAVTYKTRVQRVLKTLHAGRQTAHEYEFARVLSDAVERVGRIHSIRIAIIEPEDKVMLAVTFDGSWESYIRVIWQKVSRSLDLIFCNTEDYVTGWDHTFDEWCAWLRKSQAESSFLYSPPGLTFQDTQYLRMYERRLRGNGLLEKPDAPGEADLAVTRIQIPTAEAISDQLRDEGTDPANLEMDKPLGLKTAGRPAFRQGMRGLAGLYRLIDVHREKSDGEILHRAALELLREYLPMVNSDDGRNQYREAIAYARLRYHDALVWLCDTPALDRPGIPPLRKVADESEFGDTQGGIIHSYPGISDGCLLMLAFDGPKELADFLTSVQPTTATAVVADGDITVNIALTLQGLRLAGITDDEIHTLPEEFIQGMERRAGMLGDVRLNHPRRWRLPALNWAQGENATDVAEDDPCPRADLSVIDLVLQLRICNPTLSSAAARTRLLERYASLVKGVATPRPLSIQWMSRLTTNDGRSREHFGFLDSQSEPVLNESEEGDKYLNHINLGEILLGHDNAADTAPNPADCTEMQKLLRNGSFMVVRKLRQNVGRLEEAIASAVKAPTSGLPPGTPEAQRLFLMGKMVGRWPIGHLKEGKALVDATPGIDNDFNFDPKEQGKDCPFHAHIRRANPRDDSDPEPPGARPPRLIRRGMSYGPMYEPTKAIDESERLKSLEQERGLVFIAYNASIGEQFEVVQRWLTGGNSSGSYSGQSDPLLGMAEPGRPRYFRFEHENCPVRMRLDGSDRVHDEPTPFVRLEWGMYLFTPAIAALKTLARRAQQSVGVIARSWSPRDGEVEITRLRNIEDAFGKTVAFEAWKAAIEDPNSAADFTTASIWAAIRENHGGVLDTPLGVLVASRKQVDEILLPTNLNLTATGYLPRMHRSFGPLYLGLDAGQFVGTYELESKDVNAAIMGLVATQEDFKEVVSKAAAETINALNRLKQQAVTYATEQCETDWEVTFEAREIIDEVLAYFCEEWFGLSERGCHLMRSGMRWNWVKGEPPCYPGHFMAPSRYTFQPHPGPEVERTGAEHGYALRLAFTKYLAEFGSELTEPVARAALDCEAARQDPTFPPRTLAGVLMGFLPTTDGNIRRVLNEWLNEGTLWSLRARQTLTKPGDASSVKALEIEIKNRFIEAMQLRAAPELLWRTAVTSHVIGEPGRNQVNVRPGQIVIASLISATQQCLEDRDPSLAYAFGGDRRKIGHPTHACPGYGPAEAVMLGFFHGLIESQLALRPGPAPLTFFMEGNIELSPECKSTLDARILGKSALQEIRTKKALAKVQDFGFVTALSAPVEVLTVGDSWLYEYNLDDWGLASSLMTELKDLNYHSVKTFCRTGRTLATIANVELDALVKYLKKNKTGPSAPKAILLGGGGNDLVYDRIDEDMNKPLYHMLKGDMGSADACLHPLEVDRFIDGVLKDLYLKILNKITSVVTVPIMIHAYDYPIPDGRPSRLGPGPWLEGIFNLKGFKPASEVEKTSTLIMKILIKRINSMVSDVASKFPGQVHALNLHGTLEKQPDYSTPYLNYQKYWANELHANDEGFDILAALIRDKLVERGVK